MAIFLLSMKLRKKKQTVFVRFKIYVFDIQGSLW